MRAALIGWPGVGLALVLLAGCGFHLRGSGDVRPLPAIQVGGGGPLAAALERTLRSQGTPVVDTASQAQWIVNLANIRRERRTAAVGRTGRVQEYELHYSVRLEVADAAGKALAPSQTISVERSYSYDGTDVNAKSNEEATLYQDMQFDIVRQILMRLQAIQPPAADSPAAADNPAAAPEPAPAPDSAPDPVPDPIPDSNQGPAP
jgi:LPS-assembly lipoprotein